MSHDRGTRKDLPISRRKMLGALGLAGVAAATGGLLGAGVVGAEGPERGSGKRSVTGQVYGAESCCDDALVRLGAFGEGVTVASENEILEYTDGNGVTTGYRWGGALPHTTNADNPAADGGISAAAWIAVYDQGSSRLLSPGGAALLPLEQGGSVQDGIPYATIGMFAGATDTDKLSAALDAFDTVFLYGNPQLGPMTIPAGKRIVAVGATITGLGYITAAGDLTVIGGVWNFASGGFVSNGPYHIVYERVIVNAGSNNASAALHQNGGTVTAIDSDFSSPYRNGLYCQDVDTVTVKGGKFNHCGRSGIFIRGGTGHFIDPAECSDNGGQIAGSFSGIIVADAEQYSIGSPVCLRNAEHGISLQGGQYFGMGYPICMFNGNSGITLQDDGAGKPIEHGTINGMFSKNTFGIRFVDECNHISIASGAAAVENASYQVRLVDLGSSGRKSNKIIAKGANFYSTVGASVVNSNSSTNVNITDKHNEFRLFTGEKKAVLNVAEALNLPLDPAREILYVTTATGTDIAGTPASSIIDGMQVTIFNNTASNIVIRHNNATTGRAPFFLVGAANATLTPKSNLTFTASGRVWYESARALF